MNSSKTEFLLIGLTKQLAKTNNSSLTTTHSARIETSASCLMIEHLTFFNQISSVSKSCCCYVHICQLCCIRPCHDSKTASAIATSAVHSKLDFLYHNLAKSQITRLYNRSKIVLHVLLSKLPNLVTTPILRSVHWLKITERME